MKQFFDCFPCAFMSLALVPVSIVHGDCALDWKTGEIPGLNGVAFASTLWDPDGPGKMPEVLVVGGSFTFAGDITANCVAMWNGTEWQSLPGISESDSTVYALANHQGQLIAAGWFSFDGVTRITVARWNGNSWESLGAPMNSSVRSLAIFNGEIVAGGGFTTSGGTILNGVARWDGNSWQPLANGVNNVVNAITVFGSDLVAAGEFTNASGLVANRVARWNGLQWEPLSTGLGGGSTPKAVCLTVFNSELIVGGTFTTAGGVSANRIATWNGNTWKALGTGITAQFAGPSVNALAVSGNRLIVGGFFNRAGGLDAQGIAIWNPEGVGSWSVMGSTSGNDSFYPSVYAINNFGGEIVAAGDFKIAAQAGALRIARWDGQQWKVLGQWIENGVDALTVYEGELIAAGRFTSVGGISANRIARWDGQTWRSLGSGMNGTVNAVTVFKKELIAGGEFSLAGGASVNRIAGWDGASWRPLGNGVSGGSPGTSASVRALAVFDNQLVVGGNFTLPGNSIARWTGSTWQTMGSGMLNTKGSTFVICVSPYGSNLIAGGTFDMADGLTVNGIARWNGSTWEALADGMGGLYPHVRSLTLYQNDLIAGGSFSVAGGVSAKHVARWNGISWSALGAGTTSFVYASTVFNGELIIGGLFTSPASYISKWSGVVWTTLNGGMDNQVNGLTVFRNELIVGGIFTSANKPTAYLARWGATCPSADLNCDLVIDGLDTAPFVAGLLDPGSMDSCTQLVADVNFDGIVDVNDIPAFADCLTLGCP